MAAGRRAPLASLLLPASLRCATEDATDAARDADAASLSAFSFALAREAMRASS